MKRSFQLIAHPVKGADLINANPAWLGQCAFLIGIGVLIHIAAYGRIVQFTIDQLPETATQADRQAMGELLSGQRWVSAAFFPFKMLAGFGGSALLLYLAVSAVSSRGPIHFRQIFALEVHAETVLLLGNLSSCVAALVGRQQNPYVNPFGLDQLPGTSFGQISAANSINPFTLWYVAVLAFGTARMFRMKLWKAITAVLCTSVIMLVIEEGSFDLLRNFFHF